MEWDSTDHSANVTEEYLFHQLIPYIGNKRKLLGLISQSIEASGLSPDTHKFVDLFAGTGVVSRFARQLGFATITNDWEPYSETLNRCYLELSQAPTFFDGQSYHDVLTKLNHLPPHEDWVTKHLCPRNDDHPDIATERMFYMRRNGMRIDAIRHQIHEWDQDGKIDAHQRSALLAPLLYQCCYNSNTSGVFKGFHNGWGGQTNTALYRIKGDVTLRPACFHDNGKTSFVVKEDAQKVAERLGQYTDTPAFIYLDPPYNQHPYGANYHVLNSVTLWDKPDVPQQITGHGDKGAIRRDWRTERRSAYNYRKEAARAYEKLLQTLPAGSVVATSYSTDGLVNLRTLIKANHTIGDVQIFTRPYKRYRVSSQRSSVKPLNIEFILLTKIGANPQSSVDALSKFILRQESELLASHN